MNVWHGGHWKLMARYLIEENDLLDLIECVIRLSVIKYQANKEESDIVNRAFDEYLEQYAVTQKSNLGNITFRDIAKTNLDLYKLEL